MRNRLKSAFKTFNKGERGLVLPIVLIMLLLVGLLIPPLMSLISTGLVTGQMYENNSYELYAADAGVMDAMYLLQGFADPEYNNMTQEGIEFLFGEYGTDPYTYTLPEEVNGKTVTYEIVRDDNEYIITSTASGIDGSTTTIETRVEFPPPPPPVYMAAAALNGDLKINADVGTKEEWVSIYANGNIDMIGSGVIYGNAYHTYGYTVNEPSSGGMFYGEIKRTTPLELVKDVIPENPKNYGPKYIHNGTLSIDKNRELGPVYITGDLILSEDIQVELKGTVWVAGKIQINDKAVVYGRFDSGDVSPVDESLYSKYEIGNPYFMITDYSGTGNAISVNGNTPDSNEYKVEAALYAPYGDIYVGGNASIDGSVVGATVDILGGSRLTNPLPFEPIIPEYQSLKIKYWEIS